MERLGKYDRTINPGVNYLCCPVEYVADKISMRLQQLNVTCETKTLDNVFVVVQVVVQYKVEKAKIYDAYYKLDNSKSQIQVRRRTTAGPGGRQRGKREGATGGERGARRPPAAGAHSWRRRARRSQRQNAHGGRGRRALLGVRVRYGAVRAADHGPGLGLRGQGGDRDGRQRFPRRDHGGLRLLHPGLPRHRPQPGRCARRRRRRRRALCGRARLRRRCGASRQRGLSGVDGVVSVGAGVLPARRAAFYLSPFTSPTFTPPSAHPVDLLTPAARVLRPTLPAKVKSAMNQINEATRMREANKERAEADKIQLVKVA